jgi:hypothetical protein
MMSLVSVAGKFSSLARDLLLQDLPSSFGKFRIYVQKHVTTRILVWKEPSEILKFYSLN